MYISDSINRAIHIFDISTGVPRQFYSITGLGNVTHVFVEPSTDRIFGIDFMDSGFEVSRSGSILARYYPHESGFIQRAIVAIPTSPNGDFNRDAMWNCLDIDALVADIAAGADSALYDLTGDGHVNHADLAIDGCRLAW